MRKWLVLLVPVAVLAAYSSAYTVDAAEFAYLTRFGRPIAVLDGGDPEQAGLHFKLPWPIDAVQRLDRRLQSFDLPDAELLTRDPRGNTIDKTLTIDAYVCWRIAGRDGADRFVRAMGSVEGANLILGQRVSSELGAAIADLEMDDLISTNAEKIDAKRGQMRDRVIGPDPLHFCPVLLGLAASPLGALAPAAAFDAHWTGSVRQVALDNYGIVVVDFRLRRSNHPAAVREAIFDRIKSERAKKVAEHQSDGELQASDIRTKAEHEVEVMKADARAKAQKARDDADAEAIRIRNETQRADPQFYAFLKKLDDYKLILGDGKTLLLLSTHRELFDLLYEPPPVDRPAGKNGKAGKGG